MNVVGSRNATFACLPYIRGCTSSANPGRIVFVSSMAGIAGIFGFTAYSASKFALTGFAQVGVHVVCSARQRRVWVCVLCTLSSE